MPFTPPFMDQKVVLQVASLTRTLSVDTLFGNQISVSCFLSSTKLVGLKFPAQGFQLDCDTVPTVHLHLCRLQVSIRFPNLPNLCVAVLLCDASSQFIFTLELAPQRPNLRGICRIGAVQQLIRLFRFRSGTQP